MTGTILYQNGKKVAILITPSNVHVNPNIVLNKILLSLSSFSPFDINMSPKSINIKKIHMINSFTY